MYTCKCKGKTKWNRTHITMDEAEAKIMLLWLHTVSETTWTDVLTRERMLAFAKRVHKEVIRSQPHLRNFLAEKDAPLGQFS